MARSMRKQILHAGGKYRTVLSCESIRFGGGIEDQIIVSGKLVGIDSGSDVAAIAESEMDRFGSTGLFISALIGTHSAQRK